MQKLRDLIFLICVQLNLVLAVGFHDLSLDALRAINGHLLKTHEPGTNLLSTWRLLSTTTKSISDEHLEWFYDLGKVCQSETVTVSLNQLRTGTLASDEIATCAGPLFSVLSHDENEAIKMQFLNHIQTIRLNGFLNFYNDRDVQFLDLLHWFAEERLRLDMKPISLVIEFPDMPSKTYSSMIIEEMRSLFLDTFANLRLHSLHVRASKSTFDYGWLFRGAFVGTNALTETFQSLFETNSMTLKTVTIEPQASLDLLGAFPAIAERQSTRLEWMEMISDLNALESLHLPYSFFREFAENAKMQSSFPQLKTCVFTHASNQLLLKSLPDDQASLNIIRRFSIDLFHGLNMIQLHVDDDTPEQAAMKLYCLGQSLQYTRAQITTLHVRDFSRFLDVTFNYGIMFNHFQTIAQRLRIKQLTVNVGSTNGHQQMMEWLLQVINSNRNHLKTVSFDFVALSDADEFLIAEAVSQCQNLRSLLLLAPRDTSLQQMILSRMNLPGRLSLLKNFFYTEKRARNEFLIGPTHQLDPTTARAVGRMDQFRLNTTYDISSFTRAILSIPVRKERDSYSSIYLETSTPIAGDLITFSRAASWVRQSKVHDFYLITPYYSFNIGRGSKQCSVLQPENPGNVLAPARISWLANFAQFWQALVHCYTLYLNQIPVSVLPMLLASLKNLNTLKKLYIFSITDDPVFTNSARLMLQEQIVSFIETTKEKEKFQEIKLNFATAELVAEMNDPEFWTGREDYKPQISHDAHVLHWKLK